MNRKVSNFYYYLKEVSTLFKKDLSTNILSLFSLSFIFFILSLVISVGISSQHIIDEIRSQAQISIYYNNEIDPTSIEAKISEIDGVNLVNLISSSQARERMKDVLGTDTRILDLFDYNPFSPYIEVFISLENLDVIVDQVGSIFGVELVRDNQEVLKQLENILNIVTVFGVFIFIAVSIATVVVTAHIIRQGIYLNKDGIGTLRLLGAPTYFIYAPFILTGIILSVLAGIISFIMSYFATDFIYSRLLGSLPFVVLPKFSGLIILLLLFNLLMGISLGFIGSLIGIKSTRTQK